MKPVKNILVTTYWSFDNSLVTNYTLPYVKIIRKNINPQSKIFLLTLSPVKNAGCDKFKIFKKELEAQGIFLLNFNYKPFGLSMALKLIYILFYLLAFCLKNKIKIIHAWCTPAGALGYVLSVITGIPLILDSFEPHAQSMLETKTWKKNSFAYRVLFFMEGLQLKRAKHVICAAEGMIEYSKKTYGVVKDHYYVKPACVDLELFSPGEKDLSLIKEIHEDNIVCVYAGKFGDIYLGQEVFDFFSRAYLQWGDRFKVLLLTNQPDQEINDYCQRSGLKKELVIKRFVPHHEVAKYMRFGSFGICPVNPIPTKRYCTPIKNGEYWALGLPVVITKNISDDSDLIEKNNTGYVLKALTTHEYDLAVKKIDALLKDPTCHMRARALAETYRNFEIAEKIYAAIYA